MEIDDDIKIEVRKKVEGYLSLGNPPGFLRKVGILTYEGDINYERALEILNYVAENDEVFKTLFMEWGMEMKKRSDDDMRGDGSIVTGPEW
ncbi:MAG: hypothetical protein K8T10_13585 [Candidatus Eremiobacteraeota bacterium]|nr:hypothetical protein [Candidatus Eremiobacteraeota bacterium]